MSLLRPEWNAQMNKKMATKPSNVDEAKEQGMKAGRLPTFVSRTAKAVLSLALLAGLPAFAVETANTPGTSPGSLEVSPSGAARYSMPIALPPGVNELVPSLSLQYSSHADNGLMGVGWSLGGMYTINRCPQTIAQDGAATPISNTSSDRFCLNGKRLIQITSGTYTAGGIEYRTELDEFTRIKSVGGSAAQGPAYFQLWTKSGLLLELGNSTDSKLFANTTATAVDSAAPLGVKNTVTTATPILQWNVNKVSDRKSNYYTFQYTKSDLTGEIYPLKISYTGNNASGLTAINPTNSVDFAYESRPSVPGDFAVADFPLQILGGSRVLPAKRLKEVSIYVDGVKARTLTLEYRAPETWGAMRSVLKSVQECAYKNGIEKSCLAPTEFETSKFSTCLYDTHRHQVTADATGVQNMHRTLAQDFDGDGRTDLVSATIWAYGIRILDAPSKSVVTSGTDFVAPTREECGTAVKSGVNFGSAKMIDVNTINYGYATEILAGDVTGDGLPEVVGIPFAGASSSNALNPVVVKRQSDGTYTLVTPSVADSSDYSTLTLATQPRASTKYAWLMDVDGDGKQDVVAIKNTASGANNSTMAIFVRKGLGDGTFAQTVRQNLTIGATNINFMTYAGDVDGDGRSDLVFVRAYNNFLYADVLRGTTSPTTIFQTANTSTLLQQSKFDGIFLGNQDAFTNIDLLDVNRDGLSDLVITRIFKSIDPVGSDYSNTDRNKVVVATALSRGAGPAANNSIFNAVDMSQLSARGFVAPYYLFNGDFNSKWSVSYADIDGDGRVDLFLNSLLHDYDLGKRRMVMIPFISRGNGQFVPQPGGYISNADVPTFGGFEPSYRRVTGDFDGDGLGDLALLNFDYDNPTFFEVYPTFPAGPLPDLLTKVKDGNGAVASLVHAPLTRDDVYTRGTSAFPKVAVRPALYAVKSLTRDSGNELAAPTWTYTYAGAAVEVAGRGNLGFASTTSTDPLGIKTTTNYSQAFPYIGTVVSASTEKSGVLLSSLENEFGNFEKVHSGSGKKTYFPYVQRSHAKQFEFSSGGTLVSDALTVNKYFTDWGNLQYSSTTVTGDGKSYTNRKDYTYHPDIINLTTWRIGEVQQVKDWRTGPLPDGTTSNLTRTQTYTYDTAGLLVTTVIEPNTTALKVTNTITGRDRFGNVTGTKVEGVDIATRTELVVYDTSGRFPTSMTNAAEHVTTPIVMDKRFGLPTSVKDPNAVYSIKSYDDFGREVREQVKATKANGTIEDGPYVDTIYQLCATGTGCEATRGETYKVTKTKVGSAPVVIYFDRNGRERRAVTKGMDGRDIVVVKEYDALGRVIKVSRPYFSDSSTIQWTETKYDDVGRIWKEILPGGRTATTSYNGREITVTDPLLRTNKRTVDTLGRLVAITDALSQTQTFAYDAFGNVVRSTDVKGNVIKNTYDLLGRKTKQEDPDLGTWNYTHDVLGQVVQQIDAKTQTTTLAYDKLGRMTSRAEPDLTTTWTWDTLLKGELTSVSSSNGFTRQYAYDIFGRSLSAKTLKAIDPDAQASDPDFLVSATYDSAGRPESVTYPTGVGYKNIYDSFGYLSQVRDKDTNALYWQAVDRDAEGRVIRETLGNGLVTDLAYQPDTGYIETVQTGTLSGTALTANVQNDAYSFNAIGSLTSRSQYFGSFSLTESFGYDALNRLTSATPLGGVQKTARYDEIGNITFRSDVGDYINTGCGGVHRVCAVGFSGLYSYDNNGNLLQGNGRTIEWFSNNYPKKVTQGTTTETFLYTAERERGRRVSVENGQTTKTVYINPRIDLGGTFEKTYKPDNTVEYTHHVYAGGDVIGSIVTKKDQSEAWTNDFALNPAAVDPLDSGLEIIEAADPFNLIYWDPNGGDGRLVFNSKRSWDLAGAIEVTSIRSVRSSRKEEKSKSSFDITVPAFPAGHGYAFGAGYDHTSDAGIAIHFIDDKAYLETTHPFGGGQSVNMIVQPGTTYTVEFETGPTLNQVRLYPKGQSPSSGLQLVASSQFNSHVAANGTGRFLSMSVNGYWGDEADYPIYIDNLSEELALGKTYYWHKDHLGSVIAISDTRAAVVERFSYDAWGNRRQLSGETDACFAERGEITQRGFTAHEHLDSVRLIHMNGRVYDPVLGKFLSADPNIFYPEDTQDYNRYAYVRNDPLSLIDPSGFLSLQYGTHNSGLDAAGNTYSNIHNHSFNLNLPDPAVVLRESTMFGPAPSARAGNLVQLEAGTISISITSATGLSPVLGPHGGANVPIGNSGASVGTGASQGQGSTTSSNPPVRRTMQQVVAESKAAEQGSYGNQPGYNTGVQVEPICGDQCLIIGLSMMPVGRAASVAVGVYGKIALRFAKSADTAADAASLAGRTSGAAAELRVGNQVFTDVSTGGSIRAIHPQVQAAANNVPLAQRAPWHGHCAEVGCLSKALSAGVNPAGGTSRAVNIGASGAGHGTAKKACSSCRHILEQFGVKYD
jgi:RHS repeat-associated protein